MLIEVMGHWAAAMQAKDPTKPLSEVAALANDRYSSEARHIAYACDKTRWAFGSRVGVISIYY